MAAAIATPTITVTSTSSSAPPIRRTGASGPATWPTARLDSGTPPNGHDQRSKSVRAMAPGSASHRPGAAAGTRIAATPSSAA
jgi:hypothetical protein